MAGKKCEPGCTCGLHSPERRERSRASAKAQAEREGKEARAAQVREVWKRRSPEERSAIAAKVTKHTRSRPANPEHVAKRAQANREAWAKKTPEERRAHIIPALQGRGKRQSSLEVNVEAALIFLDITYEREAIILDRFVVDFTIGERLIIEVDGAYWHDPAKDAIRDALLAGEGYTVIRISEDDARDRPVQAIAHALVWGNKRGV